MWRYATWPRSVTTRRRSPLAGLDARPLTCQARPLPATPKKSQLFFDAGSPLHTWGVSFTGSHPLHRFHSYVYGLPTVQAGYHTVPHYPTVQRRSRIKSWNKSKSCWRGNRNKIRIKQLNLKPLSRYDVVRIEDPNAWNRKATVLQEISPSSYTVRTEDGQILKRNRRRLLRTQETLQEDEHEQPDDNYPTAESSPHSIRSCTSRYRDSFTHMPSGCWTVLEISFCTTLYFQPFFSNFQYLIHLFSKLNGHWAQTI